MTNLNSILKSREITLLTKVRIVETMVFPVVMYTISCKTHAYASWTQLTCAAPWLQAGLHVEVTPPTGAGPHLANPAPVFQLQQNV